MGIRFAQHASHIIDLRIKFVFINVNIEVDITPKDYLKGIDTQLDRGIKEILSELKKNPVIKPTFDNSKKFSSWILKDQIQKPNLFDGQRIHLIIDQMIRSSKEKKEIYIK